MIAASPALDMPRLVATTVLLTVVVWRRDMVRRGGPDRHLWFALAGLTLASLLTISTVEGRLSQLIPVPGLTVAVRRSVVMVSALFTRAMLAGLTGRRTAPARAEVAVTVVAVVLSTVPVVAWPPPADATSTDGSALATSHYPSLANYAIYVAVMGWTLVAVLLFCARLVRTTFPGRTRCGIKIVIAGVLLGFVYLVFATWQEFAGSPGEMSWARIVQGVALSGSLTLIAVGSAYEKMATATESAGRTVRFVCAHWRLHPLWRLVVTVTPHVTRRPVGDVRRLPMPLAASAVELELVDRLVEIRDAMRDLSDYVPAATQERLREELAGGGVPEDRQPAAAAAAAVLVAANRKAAGEERAAPPRSLTATWGQAPTGGAPAAAAPTGEAPGGDIVAIDRELTMLVPIAREVGTPKVRRLAAGWTARSPARTSVHRDRRSSDGGKQ